MPIGKSRNLNREKGDKGERLTQEKFKLIPTSGSGCGAFDKSDSKNDWLRVETKVTNKLYYSLDIEKFHKWRFQAAKDRKQFFMHIIHENEDKSLDWDSSLVVVDRNYWNSFGDLTMYSDNYVDDREVNSKTTPLHFDELEYEKFTEAGTGVTSRLDLIEITSDLGNLVVVPASFWLEQLERDV